MAVRVTPAGTRGSRRRANVLLRHMLAVASAMYRRGVGGSMGSTRLLLLTTRGARSGRQWTVPLARCPDGKDAGLGVASFDGWALRLAWFHPLASAQEVVGHVTEHLRGYV